MRVLLISPMPPPAGGIATWTKLYIESQEAQKHNINIINIALTGERAKKHSKYNFLEEINRLVNIIKNVKLKTKEKYDIAHINSSCSKFGMWREYLIIKILKKKNTNIIIHFHCDIPYMIKSKLQKYMIKKIIKNVDGSIVLNDGSKQYINNINANGLIYKVPNYIDENIYQMIPDFTNFEKVKNIIFVGRVCKDKGCDIIYNIAREFPQINFKLIGNIDIDFINKEKPNNVELEGEKELNYVIEKLEESDLFLFPSYTEGFPCAVLEAMAIGLPIITTPVGAIQEMLEDKGAVYCNIGKEKEFIDAIKRISEDQEKRINMSKWNRKKVEEYYREKVLEKIFKIYRSIIK